jgi:homocysteine S-methyltransferase
MRFDHIAAREPFILFEGAVIERLRRLPGIHLDPHILHAGFVYDLYSRPHLAQIYRRYMEIGRHHDLPLVVLTPTWRANPERVRQAGLASRQVNREGFHLLAALRDEQKSYARRISIGGLMGCRGDAYRPQEALSRARARRFHFSQAAALAEAGVDLLMGATLPALSEALGMGQAMAETGIPYLLSFVVRPTGTLLDGTPLHQAIAQIDAAVHPSPLAYMVNCVHPDVFAQAFTQVQHTAAETSARILGLQANTSAKPPEELDGADALQGQDPARFADAMLRLHKRLGVRALGGCCGTDDRHIAALARAVMASTGAQEPPGW